MDLSQHLDAADLFDVDEDLSPTEALKELMAAKTMPQFAALEEPADPQVHHPPHYTNIPGVEAIQVTEHFNFNVGNAIKYLLRHEHKGNPEQDLEKALWYIRRELHRRKMVKAMESKP